MPRDKHHKYLKWAKRVFRKLLYFNIKHLQTESELHQKGSLLSLYVGRLYRVPQKSDLWRKKIITIIDCCGAKVYHGQNLQLRSNQKLIFQTKGVSVVDDLAFAPWLKQQSISHLYVYNNRTFAVCL